MASVLYPKFGEAWLKNTDGIDFTADSIKALFYSGSYNAAHEFVSGLTGASIIARSGALSGKTVVSGVLDANDITVTAVSGAAFTHVILYKDTGSDATSRLIAIFDVSSFTPTGGDVNVVWNPAGLFKVAG